MLQAEKLGKYIILFQLFLAFVFISSAVRISLPSIFYILDNFPIFSASDHHCSHFIKKEQNYCTT